MDWEVERDRAENELFAIHDECKGRPFKALLRLPAALIAVKQLLVASFHAPPKS